MVYCTDKVNETCIEPYSGESGRRISERKKDHNGTDLKCHVLKQSVESWHAKVCYYDFH